MAWMDNTGLYRKFGTEKAVINPVGEYCTYGSLREVCVRVDFTLLPTGATMILGDTTLIPKMRLEEVEIVTLVTPAGGTSLALGLIRDDRVTAFDPTAFTTAIATATFNGPGTKTVLRLGSAGAGTAIGTTLANPGHILATVVGDFTAGLVEYRIRYMAI